MWSLWFCIGSGEDCVIEYLISYKLLNHSSLIGFGPDKTYLILIFPVLYIIDFIFLNERYIHFSYLQVFVASRLNVPGAWQMPQVRRYTLNCFHHFLFINDLDFL